MKISQFPAALSVYALAVLVGPLHADFDTAIAWGDAATDTGIDGTGDRDNGRASGTLTVPAAGTYEITSGGADFWGADDSATVIYDSSGAYTTTGDLTATVRHVGVNIDSARDWGRGALQIRRTEGNAVSGVPERNDESFLRLPPLERRRPAGDRAPPQRRPDEHAAGDDAGGRGPEPQRHRA